MTAVAAAREKPARAVQLARWHCVCTLFAALAAIVPTAAQAQPFIPTDCISTGLVLTCTGDRQTGVVLDTATFPTVYTTLNVGGLTTDIAPLSGEPGVLFSSDGPVNLNVNTGPWTIGTTDAPAIFASSLNTVSVAFAGTILTDGTGAVGIAAGAFGGGGINVFSAGSITTNGDFSFGIVADGDGPITIDSFGNIATLGEGSFGINAQSMNGPMLINSFGTITTANEGAIAIGGMSDGTVTVNSYGNITVEGEAPFIPGLVLGAITAESQGGSAIVNSFGTITALGDEMSGISAVAMLGEARVEAAGRIATEGDFGAGINAQGNTAFVTSGADITTRGEEAPGIGALGFGAVTVVSRGNITTTNEDSDGIIAGSMTDKATVESWGNISATGDGSAAIRAVGVAGNLVRNYGAAIGGFLSCGCSAAAGVDMQSDDDGAINKLENHGFISALSGLAIQSTSFGLNGTSEVDNYGIVTGNVVLLEEPVLGFPAAAGTFVNHTGALFNSGDTVTANLVTNDGTIAPGGRGAIIPSLPTFMSDDFVQGPTGIYAVDLDPAATVDRNDLIVVSGTAQLAGNVAVHLLSLPVTAVDSFTILQSLSSGIADTGLGLIASPALHATLLTDADNVVLGIAVDFATPDGLNPNQRAIAADLHQIYENGLGTLGPTLLGLLNVQNLGEYRNALDQLSPEIYSNAEIAALYASSAFSNSLLSCKVNGTDTASIIREGQCLWAGASARFLDSGTTSDQIGFDETAGLFTAGAQVALDNVWRLGAAGGFQSSSLQTATGAQSDGSLAQAGVSLKYNPGQLLLAGAVTGGGGWYDTMRTMSFGGFTGVAEGEQTLGLFNTALRAAYVFGDPRLFFKPILDANLTHLELSGFTESGGNGAALSVAGGGSTVFSLAPMLEAGTEWWLGNGTLVRPLIRAGAVWYEGGDFALTASFAGAPAGVSPFTINTDIDEVMGLVGAGVEVINGRDAVLRLSYDGQLGSDTQIHSVGVKGSAKF